jgi:hypothetical protein
MNEHHRNEIDRAIEQLERVDRRAGHRVGLVNRRGAGNQNQPGVNVGGRGNRQVPNNPPGNAIARQNHDNAARRVLDLPAPIPVPLPPPPVLELTFHIGTPHDKGWFYQGRFFDVPIFPITPQHQNFMVTASGPGWYSIDPMIEHRKYKRLLTLSNWESYVVPYYVSNVINHERIFILPRDAVTAVRVRVKPNQVTDLNMAAIIIALRKEVDGYPQHLVEEFTEYFVRYLDYARFCVENSKNSVYTNHRNPYAVLQVYGNNSEAFLEYGEPFRMPSVDCDIPFIFEEDPAIEIGGDFELEFDEEGHAHHVLPRDPAPGTHWYRTVCFSLEGPVRKFQHYDNSDINASKALKRLLSKNDNHDDRSYWENAASIHLQRLLPNWSNAASLICNTDSDPDFQGDPDDLEHDALFLACRRVSIFVKDRCCRSYLDQILGGDHIKWAYYSIYVSMLQAAEPWISRNACAQIPHYKKKIRLAFAKKGEGVDTENIMVKRLEAHVKNELAKSGKAPRLYVGYEEGCMYGNELPDYIKMALSEPYVTSVGGHYFTVYLCTKTTLGDLDILFNRIALGMPKNEHMVIIFSDDSVWAGNNDGVPYAFNCDISACDASVKAAGFAMSLASIAGFDPEKAIGLVKQCTLPIKVFSRSRRHMLTIQRKGKNGLVTPIEGSGTVLTTLNNFMVMFLASLVYIQQGLYGSREHILRAGILTGLNFDVSENFQSIPEKLQFLKYSPILCTDGQYHMVRNLGCILRGLGKIDGDLTAAMLGIGTAAFNAMPWAQRMELFIASIISSYVHEPSSIVMKALRDRFDGPGLRMKPESPLIESSPNNYKVNEYSLGRRYDLTPQDFSVLATLISRLKLGDVVVDDILARIYNEDYSL